MVSEDLLRILACPACDDRPAVRLHPTRTHLVCDACGRHYPIVDGIPVMLVEEAVTELPDESDTHAPPPS